MKKQKQEKLYRNGGKTSELVFQENYETKSIQSLDKQPKNVKHTVIMKIFYCFSQIWKQEKVRETPHLMLIKKRKVNQKKKMKHQTHISQNVTGTKVKKESI